MGCRVVGCKTTLAESSNSSVDTQLSEIPVSQCAFDQYTLAPYKRLQDIVFTDVGRQWFGPKVLGNYDLQLMFESQDYAVAPVVVQTQDGNTTVDLTVSSTRLDNLDATVAMDMPRITVPCMTRRVPLASQLLPPDTNIGLTGEQRRRAAIYATTADTALFTAPYTNVNQMSFGPFLHTLRTKGGRQGADANVTLTYTKIGLNTLLRHRSGRSVLAPLDADLLNGQNLYVWSPNAGRDVNILGEQHFVTRLCNFETNGAAVTGGVNYVSNICLVDVDTPDLVFTTVNGAYNWTAAMGTANALAYYGYWRSVLPPHEFALALAIWADTYSPTGNFTAADGIQLWVPSYTFGSHLASFIWEAPVTANIGPTNVGRALSAMHLFSRMAAQRRIHAMGGLNGLRADMPNEVRDAFFTRTQQPSSSQFLHAFGVLPLDITVAGIRAFVTRRFLSLVPWEVYAALGVQIVVGSRADFQPHMVDSGLAADIVMSPFARVQGAYYSPSAYASGSGAIAWYRLDRAMNGFDQTASFANGNVVGGRFYMLVPYDYNGYATATVNPILTRLANEVVTTATTPAPRLAFGKPAEAAFLL